MFDIRSISFFDDQLMQQTARAMYEAIMEYWQTSVSAPLNIRIEHNFRQITFDECISELSAGKTLGKLNM